MAVATADLLRWNVLTRNTAIWGIGISPAP